MFIDFENCCYNIFYATGLPLVVANSKFTLGLPMFKNKVIFGRSNDYFDTEFSLNLICLSLNL